MDFDADGIDDVITGSIYEDMYLFRGLGNGRFEKRKLLTDKDGKPLKGGYCCTTELLDMDADGDLDLVCATRIGKAKWYTNVGTRSSPEFDSEARLLPMAKGAGSIVGSNATYTDWDGDGKRDLVVGSEWGHVVWHRNAGEDNEPRFAAAQQLLQDPGFVTINEGDVPPAHGSRAKINIVDYDNDGLRDILLGDFTSCTYSTRPPLSKQELKQKEVLDRELEKQQSKSYFAEVNRLAKEYWAAKKAGNDQSVVLIKAKQAELRRPINELYRKLRPFKTTGYKSHGWVWLYRQVPKRDSDLAREVLGAEPATRTGELTLRTLTSHTSVAPGQEFQVAVSFQIEDGWTIYGSQQSTDYVPTTIEWDLPPGISVKGVQWPQPLSVQQGDVLQPTYQRTVTAMATIAVSRDARRDSNLLLRADVRWQVCKELVCKLGRANLENTVSVGSSVPRATTGANAD